MIDRDRELATLRRRMQDQRDAGEKAPPDRDAGSTTLLVTTTVVTAYPTAAGSFFAVVRTTPAGTEAEGATPTFATYGNPFFALNLGSGIPPTSTRVLATLDSGRWTFRYDG